MHGGWWLGGGGPVLSQVMCFGAARLLLWLPSLAWPQELEDALLLDHAPSEDHAPSSSPLLQELHCNFLNGIVDRDIT